MEGSVLAWDCLTYDNNLLHYILSTETWAKPPFCSENS